MGTLRAGAAKVDITPALGTSLAGHFEDRAAADVDDPLYARALVLESGGRRIALVACDIICLPAGDVAAARERIAARTGIPAAHVCLAATHTHTAAVPTGLLGTSRAEAYMAGLPDRIATAVGLAAARLEPARLGWGSAAVEGVTFCRRYRMRDGSVRMNPGRGNPDALEPVSPVDPQLCALYVEGAESHRPLALWATFTLHYVGTDNALAVSADYFGRFARIVEAGLGGGVALLTNGASGQINNIDIRDPRQPSGNEQGERVARAVAGGALLVAGRADLAAEAPLKAGVQTLQVRRRVMSGEDVRLAEAILAAPGEGVPEGLPPGPFGWVRGQPLPRAYLRTYAREVLELAVMPERLAAEVQVLRVGDGAVVGLPGEIFCELGLAIKAGAPGSARPVAVVGLANGYLGYVPDRAGYEQGGYETWAARSSAVEPGTGEELVEAACALLGRVFA